MTVNTWRYNNEHKLNFTINPIYSKIYFQLSPNNQVQTKLDIQSKNYNTTAYIFLQINQMGNITNICSDVCKKDQTHKQNIDSLPHLSLFKRQKAITNVHDIAFPLRADGARIVDSFDRRVKLCAYNLKGCHSNKFCVNGLQEISLEELSKNIAEAGFNCVFFFQNPRVPHSFLGDNQWLKGKRALDILDIVINSLTRTGLMVILRNTSIDANVSPQSTHSHGRWWNNKYPEAKWIDCLRSLTMRYMHNPRIVGLQIKHVLCDVTWGDGDSLTDWKRAATLAGNEILDINPNINIIIPSRILGDFQDIAESPVELKIKNKVIYCSKIKPYDYRNGNNDLFRQHLEDHLNCIRKAGYPLLLSSVTDDNQDKWRCVIDFLEQTDIDWVYSCYPIHHGQGSHLFTDYRIAVDLKRIQFSTIQAAPQMMIEFETSGSRIYETSLQPAPLPAQREHHNQQLAQVRSDKEGRSINISG